MTELKRQADPGDGGVSSDPASLTIRRRNGDEHVVLFDQADTDMLLAYTWCIWVSDRTPGLMYPYTQSSRRVGRGTTRMHVLLLGRHADHINGNGLDNRRANLRPATRSQQNANQRPRGGTSQYKGVQVGRSGRWTAKITVDRQARYLGTFDTEIEAANAYDAAAHEAWGEYARPNFPRRLR